MTASPISIDLAIDLTDWQHELNEYPTQIKYTYATAINNTMKAAQTDIRDHLQSSFIVRRSAYVMKSVKITQFASKSEPTATLAISPPGNARDVLSKFEDGGEKTPITGGSIAIPEQAIRPDIRRIIPKSKRPRNIVHAFKITANNGNTYIAFRPRSDKHTLKFAYRLAPDVHIPAKLDFVSIAVNTINTEWERQFERAWEKAVSTAI